MPQEWGSGLPRIPLESSKPQDMPCPEARKPRDGVYGTPYASGYSSGQGPQ